MIDVIYVCTNCGNEYEDYKRTSNCCTDGEVKVELKYDEDKIQKMPLENLYQLKELLNFQYRLMKYKRDGDK